MYRSIRIYVVRPTIQHHAKDKILYAAIGGRLRVALRFRRLWDNRLTMMSMEEISRIHLLGCDKLEKFRYMLYDVYKTPAEARAFLLNLEHQVKGLRCEELKND